GILIEHYAGALPLWLSPTQAVIIPIADRHLDAAKAVAAQLKAVGGRVEVMAENEPMRVKIAKAQQQKIPYMLIMGDKEIEKGTVGVRERKQGDLGAMAVEDFCRILADAQV
ncbi:MAG: threonine--tRNA ligase, partial [Coriobacteriales bacterium]|nr:threonine--tRNA ligase [Coriobacteriales bacterium]